MTKVCHLFNKLVKRGSNFSKNVVGEEHGHFEGNFNETQVYKEHCEDNKEHEDDSLNKGYQGPKNNGPG